MRSLSTFVFLVLFYSYSVYCQTPVSPNLTIGASKVLLDKGELDAQLIAEIIATKQDEVRTELAQRLILRNLRNSNIAVQNFAGDSFNLLFSKASPETKKKELLKNAAELALVIGFSEFYLVDINNRLNRVFTKLEDYRIEDKKLSKDINIVEFNFLLEYLRRLDQSTQIKFCNKFFNKFDFDSATFSNFKKLVEAEEKSYKKLKTKDAKTAFKQNFYDNLTIENKIYFSLSYYNILNVFDEVPLTPRPKVKSTEKEDERSFVSAIGNFDVPADNNFLPKPINLQQFKNNYRFSKLITANGISLELLQSQKLAREDKKGGFTSPNHLLIGMVYNVLSQNERVRQFGFFQRKNDENTGNSVYLSKGGSIKKYFSPEENIIRDKVDKLLNYYELIQRVSDIIQRTDIKLENIFDKGQILDEKPKKLTRLLIDVVEELKTIQLKEKEKLTSEQKEIIEKFLVNISKISIQKEDPKTLNDYINYLQNEIFPFFTILNIENSGVFEKVVSKIDETKEGLEAFGVFITIEKLVGIDQFDLSKVEEKIIKFQPYLSLLGYLSNLDNAVTYDKIFKFIADLGEIFVDKKAGRVLNSLVNFMDKYARIDNEQNKITFDLEGVAQDLYSQYQQNSRSRFSFSFTVGVNTATPWFTSENDLNFLAPDNTTQISNASFVSEKLGIKYKLVDWNRRYVNGLSNTKPVVNNLHLITYASGLLYQIEALNTENNFDITSLGLGVGVTFFNNLDFNISYAGQINDWFDNNYLNIGFDIQITEYLSALSKRRAQNQAKN
ncbi:MAG: hypothetical protein AAFQ94_17835 [Bacteroidota bacterium]